MKFIRHLIAERADSKTASQGLHTPQAESSEAPRASRAPEPIEAPAPGISPELKIRKPYRDRTLTRLSGPVSLEEDDVFKRLMGEESAEADNLFDDLEADPDEFAEDDSDIEEMLRAFGPQSARDPMPIAEPEIDAQPEPTWAEPAPVMPEPIMREPIMPEPIMPEPMASTPPRRDQMAADAPRDPMPAQRDHAAPFAPLPGRSAGHDGEPDALSVVSVPGPASGRSGRGAGRVKTRLLGFGLPETPVHDPFREAPAASAFEDSDTPSMAGPAFPVGWLVVTSGPGRGASFALQSGVSQIGRGADQAIRLDFGDTSISRSNHAAIAYDTEQGGFYLGHGGKANMVRLNDRPVLSTEELTSRAIIRIGETSLRFVALCDGSFSWSEGDV